MKVGLGAGVLAMPNAFHNAGWLLGTVLTFIIGFLCTYTVHILVRIFSLFPALAGLVYFDFILITCHYLFTALVNPRSIGLFTHALTFSFMLYFVR